MSLLTNKGKEAISTAISSSSQFSLVRIGFGDKQGSIYRKFVESDTSLVNEKFRINLDSVYYLPTVDNNTILKITAILTPEQSATMEAVTVREFGIYDNFNNLLIVGDTVPTITKDSNNNNGIDFEINLTLPTSEKVAKVLVTSKEGEFSNAERIKLNNIEEGATKNKTDSFLLDRKNHTGKIDIENVDGLGTILYSLETVEDNDDKLSGKVDKVTGKGLSANDYTDMEKNKLASIDINKIDNDIFDLEKRPYFMGRFQDEDEMLSLFFYDGNEEDDKKLIYNNMYYYNIGLNSVMYYNGGTWIKGNNLNIVDDLNSTVPGSVLDANQGRILKGLIDNITTMLNSDETSLDTIQEIVDFIKINRDTLNALTISSIAGLQNALNNKLDKNQNAISATKLETARTIGGVSFDGTGYGTDGTIWGGEILLADLDGFRRIGSIEPFLQAGGDLSAKEGWRIAVSLIWQISESKDEAMQIIQKLGLCEEKEAKVQLAMLERKINAVESTSAGRLFDGISAILGIRKKSSFEGEASMALEFAAEAYEKRSGEKKINVLDGQKCLTESADDGREILLTSRLVRAAVEVVSNIGENAVAEDTFDQDLIEKAAYEFHKGLAEQIVASCVHAAEKTGCRTAALSGGVFQNGLLLRLTEDGLIANGFHVLTHQMIPPNDGGIALGQAFYGMNHERKE